jgi:hypothetical protein
MRSTGSGSAPRNRSIALPIARSTTRRTTINSNVTPQSCAWRAPLPSVMSWVRLRGLVFPGDCGRGKPVGSPRAMHQFATIGPAATQCSSGGTVRVPLRLWLGLLPPCCSTSPRRRCLRAFSPPAPRIIRKWRFAPSLTSRFRVTCFARGLGRTRSLRGHVFCKSLRGPPDARGSSDDHGRPWLLGKKTFR